MLVSWESAPQVCAPAFCVKPFLKVAIRCPVTHAPVVFTSALLLKAPPSVAHQLWGDNHEKPTVNPPLTELSFDAQMVGLRCSC